MSAYMSAKKCKFRFLCKGCGNVLDVQCRWGSLAAHYALMSNLLIEMESKFRVVTLI